MTTIPGWLPVSYAVRAVTAFILGVLMIIFPGAGLMTFILFVGAFVIADGIIALVGSIARQRGSMDWAMLIYGLLGIAVGLLFLFFPTFSLVAFVLAVAAWMVVVGLATLFSSGRWRKSLAHPWLAIVLSVVAVLFGLYLWVFPLAGVASLPFTLGLFAFVWGTLMLGTAFELWRRRGGHQPD